MKTLKKLASIATVAISMTFGGVAAAETIVVGGKNFTEQQLLTSMTAQYLRAEGYDVDTRAGMGSAVLRSAQENGQVDIYWEYTGTGLIVYNDVKEKLGRQEGYEKVRELDMEKGLVWLDPSDANNTYALAMQASEAEAMGIETLSDMATAINNGKELVLASNAEWYAREDGYRPFAKAYDFKLPRDQIKRMDSGLTYSALKEGQVDVALVFATDGRIPAFDFVLLEDDRNFFPDYAVTPVIRQETLEENPELEEQLNKLSGLLDNEVMARLNARVDVERQDIGEVARNFLAEHDLI
ncbi:glycine betaine ABC transporter substrate-binding protein [Marinobacter orientalis]|uniref:Glycine betaine ABC transporter substrate-binding protein n=1 Tax=Marinobacter orientalis TaxID=1928859 RepID=A0A7Y0REI0_9GAMM|nr:glycine betaine ABC transporter substrate-binding protein [Marinobacter orientalis]NMT64777.1 glycine betaine ABC transporter substrate-binding protein [Marinobacter orientalis]TGX48768.1 glycine betaine ABC transporter substrate-binding protein [Marinobacter orientalis]